MKILAIETSCDETSAAVVEDGRLVHSVVIASASASFSKTGGVVPEEAARKQVEWIMPVIRDALASAHYDWEDIDVIAVTKGPGLLGSLLVGTTAARTLASIHRKKIIGVHHTLGHLSSTWLDAATPPTFPILTLSVSGGHTDLWLRTSPLTGALLGRTRDDAAGEAFDKGASMLGLPYPGGPAISKAGSGGDIHGFPFPSPLSGDATFDFSFSGLKTSLRYTLRDHPDALPSRLAELAASYEHAICRHLCSRIEHALRVHPEIREVHLVGGVSANTRLRMMLQNECTSVTVRFPSKFIYCTDNAAMIAAGAHTMLDAHGERSFDAFQTTASLPLEAVIACA